MGFTTQHFVERLGGVFYFTGNLEATLVPWWLSNRIVPTRGASVKEFPNDWSF
jgi:hypothetical protein